MNMCDFLKESVRFRPGARIEQIPHGKCTFSINMYDFLEVSDRFRRSARIDQIPYGNHTFS